MKKKLLALLMACAMLIMASACSSKNDPNTGTDTTQDSVQDDKNNTENDLKDAGDDLKDAGNDMVNEGKDILDDGKDVVDNSIKEGKQATESNTDSAQKN